MTSLTPDPASELSGAVQSSLFRFMDAYEALRPELYRYCRYLTRSPWDAEDLAQDALARAFVTLGRMGEPPPNPRAWLFRVASNLWIDEKRRSRELAASDPEPSVSYEPREAREAAGTLIGKLSPRERVAVLLKDVFDLSLEEIAQALSTTTGTVKATLHRGRGKLAEPEAPEAHASAAVPAVLDAFCAAFNAQDLAGLTALLLDTASVDVVGTHTDYGPQAAGENALFGMLFGAERMAVAGGGLEPRFVQGVLPRSPRCEVRVHRGEPILLLWYAHADGEYVRALNRVELEGARIACLRNYFYSPEAVAELCRELDVPFRSNGYKHCLSGR
jgi:RNA polymerase sigma-70 factor (ECF subfamily)